LTGITAGQVSGLGATDRISASNNHAMVQTMPGGTVSITTGNTAGTSYFDTIGRWVGPGISITTAYGISSTNGYFTGRVGIATNAPSALLRAPLTGSVLQMHARPGELAIPAAEVDEQDVTRIKSGQQVFIRSTGLPGREFSGTVAELAPILALPRMALR
jgi:hypothetical protein